MVLHIPPGFHPAMLAMSDGGRYFYLLARKVGDRSWERDDCERPGPMSRSPEMGLYLVFAAHFSLFSRKFLPRRPKSPLYSVLAAFGAGTLTGDPALLSPHLKLKKTDIHLEAECLLDLHVNGDVL